MRRASSVTSTSWKRTTGRHVEIGEVQLRLQFLVEVYHDRVLDVEPGDVHGDDARDEQAVLNTEADIDAAVPSKGVLPVLEPIKRMKPSWSSPRWTSQSSSSQKSCPWISMLGFVSLIIAWSMLTSTTWVIVPRWGKEKPQAEVITATRSKLNTAKGRLDFRIGVDIFLSFPNNGLGQETISSPTLHTDIIARTSHQ